MLAHGHIKVLISVFFTWVVFSLRSNVFLEYIIEAISWSDIWLVYFAKRVALINKYLVTEVWKLSISEIMKNNFSFPSTLIFHSLTEEVPFRCFISVCSCICLFILSMINLTNVWLERFRKKAKQFIWKFCSMLVYCAVCIL